MTRRRIGTRRALFFAPSVGQQADLMSGADGNLTLASGNYYWNAGDIKRFDNVSIASGVTIYIRGWVTYGLANTGVAPILIGVKGNCTISTGAQFIITDNAGVVGDYYGDQEYFYDSVAGQPVPFDCAAGNFSYYRMGNWGGYGGETAGWGTVGGSDADLGSGPTGHGGGGGGYDNGGTCNNSSGYFGVSGEGGPPGNATSFPTPGIDASDLGFGHGGNNGVGGEVGTGFSIGAGGSGGTRGLSGGCLYLQIAGTANIGSNVFWAVGQSGGDGGAGGAADSGDDTGAAGGGGGGGGAGGSGGTIIIRYKTGTIDPACAEVGGTAGGFGGIGGSTEGTGPEPWQAGGDGTAGYSGTVDIATY